MIRIIALSFVLLISVIHFVFASDVVFSNKWTKLKGGYLIAVSKDAYQKANDLLVSKDQEAVKKMIFVGLVRETIEATEVFVENVHIFEDLLEVRLKGSVNIYWVSEAAAYSNDDVVPKNQSKQINEQPANVVKIEGVMLEGDDPVVFILQNGRIKPMKVGDQICNGKISEIFSPGETDGSVPGPNLSKYRIKLQLGPKEEIFANGDVVCSE